MSEIRNNADKMGVGAVIMSRPELWQAFLALADEVMHKERGLSNLQKELIGAYISKRSECNFCHLSHLDTAEAISGQEVRALVDHPTEELGRLFELADKIVANHAREADFERLRQAGHDDEELEDLVFVASLFGFTTRVMTGFGIEYQRERDRGFSKSLAKGYVQRPG